MKGNWFRISIGGTLGLLCAAETAAFDPVSDTKEPANDKVQRIRFKEDDAQNYMVSKVYHLKHLKANDLVPFVLGAVKRYSSNSTVDRINYTSSQQMMVVTTGVKMMPYVDDMVAKLDRPSAKRGEFGSLLDGTGIIRYVYTPKYRSSEDIINIMINTGIPYNAKSGRKQVRSSIRFATILSTGKIPSEKQDLSEYISLAGPPDPADQHDFKV